MSNFRHPDSTVRIRSMGVTLEAGHQLLQPPGSVEGWNQLIYATRGVLAVHTQAGTWVVPPHRGVWIPEGFPYRLEMSGTVALRSLYIRARRNTVPRECSVVNVTPLMRELIVRANRIGALDRAIPEQRRLIGVILDELKLLASVPLQLPLPKDPRAQKFAAQSRLLEDVEMTIRRCGASRRTLERIFRAETGMSLGQWVRRRKLLDALRRLAGGECVDAIALELGYNSASAFIAMFRRELGQTPKRYFER
jgi:AraC-like DNA-binding protein